MDCQNMHLSSIPTTKHAHDLLVPGNVRCDWSLYQGRCLYADDAVLLPSWNQIESTSSHVRIDFALFGNECRRLDVLQIQHCL